MKAALYARVSTEKDQNPEVQVAELKRYCVARGWKLSNVIIDHGYSGGSTKRPGLIELLKLVRARNVDVIIVTKLDRLARSLKHLIEVIEELSSLGVILVSVGDQIDLSSASGRLMLHIVAAFAEFERSLVRERTLLGLAYARSKGIKLGRPRLHDPQAILRLRATGLSYRAISRQLKIPMGSITRAIKGAPKSPSEGDQELPIKTGGSDA